MIRLITKDDISVLNSKYSLDTNYLESLINNMSEYMYISVGSEIDGYMICFNDGTNIIIKDLKYNESNISFFLEHLKFNANKNIIISLSDELLKSYLIDNGFSNNDTDKIYKKPFNNITPNNVTIYKYYEQNDEFKNLLLNQINEPLWGGARYLYNKIINNDVNGEVYVIYDEDNKHIIAFASLSDFDEIVAPDLKPWIGCVYTFRPYRGNRYSEKLINYIIDDARKSGIDKVYLSSDHIGLYEKYGFKFVDMMNTVKGEKTQVFVYNVNEIDDIKR